MFYKVAVFGLRLPPLTYSSPEELNPGSLVRVKLRGRERLGVVWQKDPSPPPTEIKEIEEVINFDFFSLKLLRFYHFCVRYYFVYPSDVLSLAFPFAKISQKKLSSTLALLTPPPPSFRPANFSVSLFLGKREEEEMRILLNEVAKNFPLLFLVPEVTIGERVFSSLQKEVKEIVFYHRQRKISEGIKIWSEIKSGKYKIIVGLKQAVFLPILNLKKIFVKEEESQLYKEDKRHFRYQGRDCALLRGKIENIPVGLFSLTPSLTSYAKALKKKYKIYGDFKRPNVKLIISPQKGDEILTETLKKFLAHHRKGERAYLLIQHQGFARYIYCLDCGFIPRCPACGFSFFYHKEGLTLTCHICRREEKVFDECPKCGGTNFLFKGIGRERVVAELRNLSLQREGIIIGSSFGLSSIRDGELNFASVISLEQLLSFPDYRTEERALQTTRSLLFKIRPKGFLIIQTKNPSHPLLNHIFNPIPFYRRLLKEREDSLFPPFTSIIALKIFADEETVTKRYEEVKDLLKESSGDLTIFPPFRSHQKKRGKLPYIILLKTKPGIRLSPLLKKEVLFAWRGEVEVDVNPANLLT